MPPKTALRALVALSLLTACSASPPPPAPAPAPTASTPPPSVAELEPRVEAPADPEVVRCGIDDRPRSILGATERADAVELRAKRAISADMAPSPIAPRPPVTPPGVPVAPPAMPRVTTTLAPPRLAGGAPASAELAAAFAASTLDLEGCEALATPDDEGSFALAVTMASGGTPLTIRADSRAGQKASPYARCVMERSCRLRGDAGAPQSNLSIPVAVRWNFGKLRGKAPTRNGAVLPQVFFEARDDANASPSPFFRALRQLVRQAARSCIPQVDGAEVRVTVTLGKGKTPTIASVKTEDLAPGIPPEAPECLTTRLKSLPLGERPPTVTSDDVVLVVSF